MVVKWPLIPIIDQGPHFQALPIFNTMQTDSQKEAKVKQAGKNKSKGPREKIIGTAIAKRVQNFGFCSCIKLKYSIF